jgi:hypothetical protein
LFFLKKINPYKMKKIYFLSLLLAISGWVSAQTFLSEDFSSGIMPPDGWSIDAHAANWSAEASAKAGGNAPEAAFYYDPSFNAASRLISPYIDLTGYTSVTLMFKHFLDDYSGTGYSLGVATRTGTGTWNTVWSVSPTGDIGPEEMIVDISNGDVGASDFQFCIFFNGNSYNLDWWYIDDVLLFIPYDLDGAMAKITTPTYFPGTAPVMGIVRNMGNTTITSMDVTWTIDGTSNFTTTIGGLDLAFSESVEIVCDDFINVPIGGYELTLSIDLVNGVQDDNADNNVAIKAVNAVSHVIDRKPCFEEFTSSTCSPCATFNTTFNPWTQEHEDDITLIKYQMNWPGSGDPYYTAEGGVRRNYYGVSYVPWPQCNGAYVDYNVGAVQAAYDEAIEQPGLARIAATHTLDGTEITVTANFLPFANFNDFRAHIIVIENTTTQNVSSNGETEFHHVMMKMMPDANGTVMNVLDRNPVSITETVDLAGTNIEEFDDLSVVVLFQEYTSKEIYQSVYSVENGTYTQEARCSGITYDGIPIPGFDPDVFDYTIELPEGSPIPVVEATAMDGGAVAIVEPTWILPGITFVDCFADDNMTYRRYNIHFDLAIGLGEPVNPAALVQLYPNPAKDQLFVNGIRTADVRIFSISGQPFMALNGFTGNTIDIRNLQNGMYTIQFRMEDGTVVNKKISVVR